MDTQSSLMDNLYNFLIRDVGPLCSLERPTEQVNESLHPDVLNEDLYVPNDKDMGVLVVLYDKYLKLRLSPGEILEAGHSGFLKYFIEGMCEAYIGESENFRIEDLWKLEANAHKVRTGAFKVGANAISAYGKTYTVNVVKCGVIKYISYFGEFLYCCSSHPLYGTSLIAEIKQTATANEKRIIDQLSRIVTPELGISTFIVYRNFSFDGIPYIRDCITIYWNDIEACQGLESFHNAYCKSLKQVERSEVLREYLRKMCVFLSSKSSSTPRFVDYNVLLSDEFRVGFLKNKDYVLKLETTSKLLLGLLSFLVEALLFLESVNGNTVTYKDIPNFLKCHWIVTSCTPVAHVLVFLLEAMQLLDFVFVDNFYNGCLDEFVDICKKSNYAIGAKFSMLASHEPSMRIHSLFLFFGMNPDYCDVNMST